MTTNVHDENPAFWPDASLLGVAAIWGINIPLMKTGLEQVDVYVFNALRLTISATVLVWFAWRQHRQGRSPPLAGHYKQLLIYGLAIAVFYQLLFLLGIARTTAGNTALIIATTPIWTALLARLFIAERLRAVAWCGLFVALIGTAIVAFQKGDVTAGREHLLGNLMVLAAALLWAGGTVYSRPLLRRITPLQLAAAAAAVALPVHLLLATGRYAESMPALRSGSLWLILLYGGVLSSGLSQPMWSFGVRHAGAAHAAVIQNLIPLVAIAVAWVSRGETPTTAQLVGGALILSGLLAMRINSLRQFAPSRSPQD